jgi:serine/threonine protein kinase
VYGGKALGAGAHGKVFSSADGSVFIKSFGTEAECTKETSNLEILKAHKIPFTVRLEAVSVDRKAFMGTPNGDRFRRFQGQTVVWTMGVQLVQCLHRVHEAGLCHRDVRPENVVVAGGDVCLIDWASATPSNEECDFIGTLCYAPQRILESLAVFANVKPTPVHDLESLVYTMYDVSRPPESRPLALTISDLTCFYTRCIMIKEAWEQEAKDSLHLAELLGFARSGNYSAPEEAFRKH